MRIIKVGEVFRVESQNQKKGDSQIFIFETRQSKQNRDKRNTMINISIMVWIWTDRMIMRWDSKN